MSKTNATQAISSERIDDLAELATLLNVPKSRVLDTLLAGDVSLLATAVLKPSEARRRLTTMETLQMGREVGEAVIRYMETRESVLASGASKQWSTFKDDTDDSV